MSQAILHTHYVAVSTVVEACFVHDVCVFTRSQVSDVIRICQITVCYYFLTICF